MSADRIGRAGPAAACAAGLAGSGRLLTRAWAADVGKDGVFGRRDTIGFRIAQPLRVAHGGLDVTLPTYWDYATLSATELTTQRLNLAPDGRERDYELRYATPFGRGHRQHQCVLARPAGQFRGAGAGQGRGGAVRDRILTA